MLGQTAGAAPAAWPARAGAFALDVLLGTAVVIVCLLLAWSADVRTWVWWLAVTLAGVVFLAMAVNRLLLPSLLGWSLGRSVVGIAAIKRDGAVAGPWRLLVRDLAHLLDTAAVFVGWLWPLVDSRGRTFADLLTGTEVVRVAGERPNTRRLAGAVVAVTALIGIAATGVGYVAVYRPALAVEQAQQQLAVQGPKIVAQLLSYDVATIDDDFARARGLATNSYRPKLVAQQDAVRKAGPVDNDYWVTNSAVLTNTRDRGVVLVLMQGQRGAAPKQRLITATVKVDFERSASGQWQVANLSVLARPNPAGQAK
ncbi:RDD family protein [Mycolicibacterium sp. CBM1]